MNYEQKYLKYKNKYINLKLKIKQKGGDDPIKQTTNTVQENTVQDKPVQSTEQNYLIVSHNTRIRCFINTLLDANNQQLNIVKKILNIINITNQKKETEIRFQNGAVLKLTLKANSDIGTLELFHSGEVTDADRLYFDKVKGNKRIEFPKIEFDYVKSFKMDKLEKNINFYLVRHGEGVHNNLSTIEKGINFITRSGKDPKLTAIGIEQAKKTGEVLKEINFSKIFVSKLERTWETAYWILKDNISKSNVKINYIVLPCSHELTNYSDTKNCDEANSGVPVGTENISNCESILSSRIEKCDEFKYNNETIKINWFYYNEFYSEKIQLYGDFGAVQSDTYKKSNNKCRDSNMILQALITLD